MALIDSDDLAAQRATVAVSAPAVRPLWLIAPIAAIWAALVSVGVLAVPVIATWLTSPGAGDWLRAVRITGLLWAVSLGVPVKIAGVEVSLLPWGLVVIPAAALVYAGGWMAKAAGIDTPREIPKALALVSACYAALACTAVLLCRAPGGTAPIARTMLCSAGIAAICCALGILRARRARFLGLVRADARLAVRAAISAVAVLAAFAAAFGAATFIGHFSSAQSMLASLDPGPVGGFALLLLSVAYLPVVLTWLIAYLLGASTWIGPDAALGLLAGSPPSAELPPLPVLAALPDASPPAPWALGVAAVAAGATLALTVSRGRLRAWRAQVGVASAAALLAAALLAFAAAASQGSLGEGALADIGPSPGIVGLLSLVALCASGVPLTLLMSWAMRGRVPAVEESSIA